MRKTIGFGFSLLLVASLAAGQTFAADGDGHREAGAHEHGHGTFNMVIDGDAVQVELIAPGADIVGFESAAKTDAQKAALAAARAKLARVEAIVALPKGAGCSLVNADVEGPGNQEQETGKGHDHGHEKADAKEEHGETHSEFHVTYTLKCSSPGALGALTFSYFESFKGAQELDVTVVTGKGQKAFEVKRSAPEIRLDGLV